MNSNRKGVGVVSAVVQVFLANTSALSNNSIRLPQNPASWLAKILAAQATEDIEEGPSLHIECTTYAPLMGDSVTIRIAAGDQFDEHDCNDPLEIGLDEAALTSLIDALTLVRNGMIRIRNS